MLKLEGVFTALITPFKNDAVDYEGLKNNIRLQLKSGVRGLVPLGTTGETPTLTPDECTKITEITISEARGKAAVIVGTGSNSTRHTIENTSRAKELGADAALIVTPYYNKPTQAGIFSHFEAITEAVDLPIVIYNIQGRTGVNIETDTLEKISRLPGIIGVKEASGSLSQMSDVLERIQNHNPAFSVVSGDDNLTVPLMALGGRGVISVVSNLVPSKVAAMVDAMLRGDLASARRTHFELLPLFRAAFLETNPIPIKEALSLCGLPAGACRLPLTAMQSANRDKLKKVLADMGLLK